MFLRGEDLKTGIGEMARKKVGKLLVALTGDGLTTYEHRSDESNHLFRLRFCNRCGTTVTWIIEHRPGVRMITVGTLDDPNWVKIEMHIWKRSAQHWVVIPQNVDCFEKGSQGTPNRR